MLKKKKKKNILNNVQRKDSRSFERGGALSRGARNRNKVSHIVTAWTFVMREEMHNESNVVFSEERPSPHVAGRTFVWQDDGSSIGITNCEHRDFYPPNG